MPHAGSTRSNIHFISCISVEIAAFLLHNGLKCATIGRWLGTGVVYIIPDLMFESKMH